MARDSTRRVIRRWLKRGAIVAVVLVLLAVGALETLRRIASRRGVSAVELPLNSEIGRRAVGADYTDAYSVVVSNELTLDGAEFGSGREVSRTADEVVWRGTAPGLYFYASYHLDAGPPRRFTLGTAVFYESVIGAAYFFPVRFGHRRVVPFVVSRMAVR